MIRLREVHTAEAEPVRVSGVGGSRLGDDGWLGSHSRATALRLPP